MKAREVSASACDVREMTLVIVGLSGGAWRRVAGRLDLKFSGLVDLRPLKTPVGQFCEILNRFAQI